MVSASPWPELEIVIMSSLAPPLIVSVPAPTKILNFPEPAPDMSILLLVVE